MEDKPLIVGICGKKRHGKDSIGKILARHHGFTTTAFADPLKLVAMDLFWLSYDQCYGGPGIDREEDDPRWGISPRHIMQQVGTEVGRNCHPEVWVRNTIKLIEDAWDGEEVLLNNTDAREFEKVVFAEHTADKWAVTDVRFPNEARGIREAGGIVVKVVRPSLGESGDIHASETSVDQVEEDHLIINDGTWEELTAKVAALPFLEQRSATLGL